MVAASLACCTCSVREPMRGLSPVACCPAHFDNLLLLFLADSTVIVVFFFFFNPCQIEDNVV